MLRPVGEELAERTFARRDHQKIEAVYERRDIARFDAPIQPFRLAMPGILQ